MVSESPCAKAWEGRNCRRVSLRSTGLGTLEEGSRPPAPSALFCFLTKRWAAVLSVQAPNRYHKEPAASLLNHGLELPNWAQNKTCVIMLTSEALATVTDRQRSNRGNITVLKVCLQHCMVPSGVNLSFYMNKLSFAWLNSETHLFQWNVQQWYCYCTLIYFAWLHDNQMQMVLYLKWFNLEMF